MTSSTRPIVAWARAIGRDGSLIAQGWIAQVEVTSLGGPEEDTATVDAKILQLRKNRGTMKVVPGRPLQIGDVAIVDFKTVRADTGENIVGSQRKGMQLDTGLGDRAIGLTGAAATHLLTPKVLPTLLSLQEGFCMYPSSRQRPLTHITQSYINSNHGKMNRTQQRQRRMPKAPPLQFTSCMQSYAQDENETCKASNPGTCNLFLAV